MQRGTEALSPQACEGTILEAGPPAPSNLQVTVVLAKTLTMRDPEPKPHIEAASGFVTLRNYVK